MKDARAFEVLHGGVHSTVQDLGRPGLLATGMPPSGPADRFALGIANLVVGNDSGDAYLVGRRPGAAGIEILLSGLRLRALRDVVVALTGADLAPILNGRPVPMWETVLLRAGDVLAWTRPRSGARAYLAVSGGIDVPVFAGSRATNVRAMVGGFEGRALRKGDALRTLPPSEESGELRPRRLRSELVPRYGDRRDVRVVLRPTGRPVPRGERAHLPHVGLEALADL